MVTGVVVYSNGERFATASDDNTVKIWKTSNSELLHTESLGNSVQTIGINKKNNEIHVFDFGGGYTVIDTDFNVIHSDTYEDASGGGNVMVFTEND